MPIRTRWLAALAPVALVAVALATHGPATANETVASMAPPTIETPAESASATATATATAAAIDTYAPDPLSSFEIPGLDPRALALAREGYACALKKGTTTSPILTVIDYSRPSTERRLWVVDVQRNEVLFNELVAHGKNTGEDLATRFSNIPSSNQTSLGWYRTASTYTGKHGRSLRLDGLETGWNEKARSRAIVIHGADYVSERFIAQQGRLGRSFGCPALDHAVAQQVIDVIADGSMLLAYYPDETWLGGTTFTAGCD